MIVNSAVSGSPQPSLIATDPQVAANNRAISTAVKLLNSSLNPDSSRQFSIAIDPATRQAVIRVVDSTTNELVEQLPSEYILAVARQLSERIAKQSAATTDKTL